LNHSIGKMERRSGSSKRKAETPVSTPKGGKGPRAGESSAGNAGSSSTGSSSRKETVKSPSPSKDAGSKAGNNSRYENLIAEQSQAQNQLEEMLKVSAARERELEEECRLLRKKIKLMEDSNPPRPKESEEASKELEFYRLITGTTVSVDNSDQSKAHRASGTAYVCTTTNTKTKLATQYTLRTDKSATISFQPKANAELLPEYLRAHISFESGMAPVLFADIIQTLYPGE
jgi:hypothetical protein